MIASPAEMMAQMARQQAKTNETLAIMQVCAQIVTRREALCTGETSSAASHAVVQAADRVLLTWLNGLQSEEG